MLFALWMAFSGVFVAEFMIIGGISAVGAIAVSELLFRGSHEGTYASAPRSVPWYVKTVLRFLVYLPWLAYQIVISNFHVAFLVLHPKMPIDPTLVEFDTTLVSERAQVTLAQSITLTPGTVTVDASDGKFLIHCLSRTTRQGIEDGVLQKRVAQVFGEPWVEHVELTDIESASQVPQ
ncbi:MAG: Na+/H+ antiporter subunit E [Chloroflexi bacterium]|nr:Na+/H+ antiporter subunit E [Chloroflexota bacterium]MDA1173968.1 Na+/H+ antiporter subunit E [Chloroflexota bacterium]